MQPCALCESARNNEKYVDPENLPIMVHASILLYYGIDPVDHIRRKARALVRNKRRSGEAFGLTNAEVQP